ncbi:MAG: helix-turn-helix domain-containing protein [Candidatus Thiosymbion ectosymbiont of Robbea hypermnestra]|nr:helix-turn-helix domain-containing protein [Candidatus Thiosymbion ectosymbiont of Robbea hypermnestra]
MNTLGSRVTAARNRAGFSQAELAKRVGVTPGAINKIESGETKGAKPETLAALGRALGVSMEWLATGKETQARVADMQGDYAPSQKTKRLLTAWAILPDDLQGSLLALVETMAGLDGSTRDQPMQGPPSS